MGYRHKEVHISLSTVYILAIDGDTRTRTTRTTIRPTETNVAAPDGAALLLKPRRLPPPVSYISGATSRA